MALASRPSAHSPSMAPYYLQDRATPTACIQSCQPGPELRSQDSSPTQPSSWPDSRPPPRDSLHGAHAHHPLQACARASPSAVWPILSPLPMALSGASLLPSGRCCSFKPKTPGVRSAVSALGVGEGCGACGRGGRESRAEVPGGLAGAGRSQCLGLVHVAEIILL